MQQPKKQRGAKPLPKGEKKKVIQFYLKEKFHKPFLKEINPLLKKYQ